MPDFKYTRRDGSQEFTPQSMDRLFDEISRHMMDYGEYMLDNLEQMGEEHPDLMQKLIEQGYVDRDETGRIQVTPRGVKRVENQAIEELFHVTGRSGAGRHETGFRGAGQTVHEDSKPYEYGDPVSNLNMHETLRNAITRQGNGTPIEVAHDDLVVYDTEYQANCATVVLLDMSGSMNRYGKYGQAKRVAMALQGLVRGRYQGDFLQIVGFYSYASPMTERDLLYSVPKEVSIHDPRVHLKIHLDSPPGFVPQHFTNIHAGLQFARRILKKQPSQNRQIITITDGEPTAHIEARDLYLIYPPAERTARITLAEARRCAAEGIHLSSFALVEDYFYLGLVNFVEQMAKVSGGVAAYCNAGDLGNMVVDSFHKGRRQRRAM